jgi:flagellar assembly factor FliW
MLQSTEDVRFSLIVTGPQKIDPEYELTLSEADAETIQYTGERQLSWPGQVDVYCILSVQEDPFEVTINMLGPLVINWETGLGVQAVLTDSGYETRKFVAAFRETTG